MRLTSPIIAVGRPDSQRSEARTKTLLCPLPPVTVFQAEAGRLCASSLTAIGLWPLSRRNTLVGRPSPFHSAFDRGASPGFQTLTDDMLPTT
jgi:hypothetical protein